MNSDELARKIWLQFEKESRQTVTTLHSTVSQSLAVTSLRLMSMDPQTEEIRELISGVQEGSQQVRNVMDAVHLELLDFVGLGAALLQISESLSLKYNVEIIHSSTLSWRPSASSEFLICRLAGQLLEFLASTLSGNKLAIKVSGEEEMLKIVIESALNPLFTVPQTFETLKEYLSSLITVFGGKLTSVDEKLFELTLPNIELT